MRRSKKRPNLRVRTLERVFVVEGERTLQALLKKASVGSIKRRKSED